MNPPYIPPAEIAGLEPEVRQFEPETALTDHADGLSFFRRLAELIPEVLTPAGLAFVEIGYGQAEAVSAIFRGASCSVDVKNDLAGIARTLIVARNQVATKGTVV